LAQLADATIACAVAVLVPSAIECHCCYSLVQRTSERRHSGGRVNTLGEVIDGDWYVNRHANHRMTTAELQRGHGNDHPPLASAPWQVLIVKPFGVNPGLLIADAKNDLYIMRFDLRDHEGLATGAQMVNLAILLRARLSRGRELHRPLRSIAPCRSQPGRN